MIVAQMVCGMLFGAHKKSPAEAGLFNGCLVTRA